MKLIPHRILVVVDTRAEAAGRPATPPLRKTAVIGIVRNPFAGRYVEDLSALVTASEAIAALMAEEVRPLLRGEEVQSYGKGGIVGLAGEQEHANALLTTTFATPFRDLIGNATAWISSFTKVGGPGTAIDIPMNSKTDVYVRSHYDGMSLTLADGPQPDEVALIFCMANRGRLDARVGGLTYAESLARKPAPGPG